MSPTRLMSRRTIPTLSVTQTLDSPSPVWDRGRRKGVGGRRVVRDHEFRVLRRCRGADVVAVVEPVRDQCLEKVLRIFGSELLVDPRLSICRSHWGLVGVLGTGHTGGVGTGRD